MEQGPAVFKAKANIEVYAKKTVLLILKKTFEGVWE